VYNQKKKNESEHTLYVLLMAQQMYSGTHWMALSCHAVVEVCSLRKSSVCTERRTMENQQLNVC